MENLFTPLLLIAFFVVFILAIQFRGKRSRKSFDDWHETYYLVAEFIITERNRVKASGEVENMQKSFGTSGMFSLAKRWTDEFQELHKNEFWEELDFYDEVEIFCKQKNNE
jgi:hypothetical protein